MLPHDPTTWTTLYFASEWVIRLIMIVVVPFRRTPAAAKGWLLLLFFLPWPGLILYHLIGRPTYPKWRLDQVAKLPPVAEPIRERISQAGFVAEPPLPESLAHASLLVRNLGRMRPLAGNSTEIIDRYDAWIDRLVADIDSAAQSVHLMFYIFANDATGMKVIEAIRRATARGVACRVLIDYLGSSRWRAGTLAALHAAGAEAHCSLPVKMFHPRARLDLRNHAKIAVIDGAVAHTGSQNIVDSTFKPGLAYEDLMVRLVGPVGLELQALFAADWFLESGKMLDLEGHFPAPDKAGSVDAQVLPSSPDFPVPNVQRLVVALIHAARERVVLTTPYLVPDEALLQALQTAVLRGIEVHIVVASQPDQVLVCLAQRSYYDELLSMGVVVHEYHARFLHAKHVSIDGEIALIGSSNMDIRSFVLNAEAVVVLYDKGVTADLRRIQERYFAESNPLDLEVWRRRPLRRKIAENLARLMSPLL
ncbi:MAG: cardiolipin synthase [Phycisphaeraceae bacterium]|nr:cardiolipin synthase [Phycisphaeraceae bacterium]